jgi:hypothetical protein
MLTDPLPVQIDLTCSFQCDLRDHFYPERTLSSNRPQK